MFLDLISALFVFVMAASANPGGHSNVSNGGNSNGGGAEKANGGVVSGPENSAVEPTQGVLRHNPGISLDWTAEEQSTLEDLLAKSVSGFLICLFLICACECEMLLFSCVGIAKVLV